MVEQAGWSSADRVTPELKVVLNYDGADGAKSSSSSFFCSAAHKSALQFGPITEHFLHHQPSAPTPPFLLFLLCTAA